MSAVKVIAFVIGLLCILNITSAGRVTTRTCGSTNGQLLSISGPACSGDLCRFKGGEFINLEVKFRSDVATDIVVDVYSVLRGGRPIPYHSWAQDLCFLLGSCPLTAGEDYTFKISMQIPSGHPQATAMVNRIQIKSSDEALNICTTFNAIIE